MKEQNSVDVNIVPQLDKACGLDMHKDKIVGFISCKDGIGQELKEFGTFTCELNQVKAWLQEHGVEHCLMESTGIYWMSLYAILTSAGISVTVANPTHIKQVPKRKTDRKDAKWLCTLLLNGLVRPSFMPTAEPRILRSALIYLNGGEDLAIPLAKVDAAGGKVIMPKTSIGPNGFMGRFIDTEGNRMAFHSMH